MKVLVVHNYYGNTAPSGENDAVDTEVQLLRKAGITVRIHSRDSSHVRQVGLRGKLVAGLCAPWNEVERWRLSRAVHSFRPAIVHVHNWFPLISPSAYYFRGKAKAPIVQSVHNSRMFCVKGIPLRDGKVCFDCLERGSPIPALRHACYGNSRVMTLPLVASQQLHSYLGTWNTKISAFLVLTKFQKEKLHRFGIDPSKVFVKPNAFLGLTGAKTGREKRLAYVGRVSPEKGVLDLVKAWKRVPIPGYRLTVAGDGPDLEEVRCLCVSDPTIETLGRISSEDAVQLIQSSAGVIVPSRCIEGFPMVIREAFACGTPVLASDLGPMSEILDHGQAGLLFSPGVEESLISGLNRLAGPEGETAGRAGKRKYDEQYSQEAILNTLLQTYQFALRPGDKE